MADRLSLSTNPDVRSKLRSLERRLFVESSGPKESCSYTILFWLLRLGKLDKEEMWNFLLRNNNPHLDRSVFEGAWEAVEEMAA